MGRAPLQRPCCLAEPAAAEVGFTCMPLGPWLPRQAASTARLVGQPCLPHC